MLTYDALIEQARERGTPHTKIRGILREYLQVLILKELYKTETGKKLYFTGGTYLRLIHNLKRFSEDLDFNTGSIRKQEFESLIKKIRTELRRTGVDCRVKFRHWKNIYAAHLIFPTIEKIYNVSSMFSRKEGIVIKIETNRPKWKIKKESEVISGFGEFFPCLCTDKGALFADKIDALNKKSRGRHVYDIMFMLSHRFSIDRKALATLGIEDEPLDVIAGRIASFSNSELKKQAETLRPFLFDESEADLIINAHKVMPGLLEKYSKWSVPK